MPILYSYFRCTGRLFFRCALCVACYSIIRASWESKKGIMIELQKKYIHFFWQHAILSISFLLLSLSTPIPFSSDLLAEWPLYLDTLLGVVFCVMISWLSSWKYENILQFNTSWLVFLSTWYYFRLSFSFSYSGYDHTLIKETHTLTCYSFSQKFLLREKT